MNAQQTRIEALLHQAYDEAAMTGRLPIDLAVELVSEGYDLRALPADIKRINEDY